MSLPIATNANYLKGYFVEIACTQGNIFKLRFRLRKRISPMNQNMKKCSMLVSRIIFPNSFVYVNKYGLVLAAVILSFEFDVSHFLLLFYRYGENVTEAVINPKWTCPACRGICNCNSCRRKNGWMSTGNIYNKVSYCTIWDLLFVSLLLFYLL